MTRSETADIQLVVDFDSTFVVPESLEVLAEVALAARADRDARLAAIRDLTNEGMEGRLGFSESLRRRLALLSATRREVAAAAASLCESVTPSIARHRAFFQDNRHRVVIISGGFRDMILPVVEPFGVPADHVFANELRFDSHGAVIGVDDANPLAHDGGKVAAVRSMDTAARWVVGDGMTDYEIRGAGLAELFWAFTENVARAPVVARADRIAPSFDPIASALDP